ncbi:hypothetical protein PROSTU_00037 [Providencia stuartii ATCC 25827]|uniref:Uncharacterized protein n=1 Tax=Providencia stuartii ATCC 25827 TaxID=471874 RepID=A0AA86YX51_PROST|nr:hypothetical protein PROSTU_00037 [Providencia stuartii ATCC 25827]
MNGCLKLLILIIIDNEFNNEEKSVLLNTLKLDDIFEDEH